MPVSYIKDRRHELRRATLGTLQRVHKCIEVGGGIFENLLWDMLDVDGPGICPLQIISNTGQCESGNARCIAWSHFEGRSRIWMSQRKLQRTTSAVYNRSAACFATGVDIFENNFKHRPIKIKGNFTKLTLHLYFKCIMYYVVLLFSSLHCQ